MRRRWVGLGAATLAVLLAAACTTSATSDGAGQTTGNTLTIAIAAGNNSLALPTNCSSPLFSLTYASLINVEPDGSYGPGLAKSWKYSDNNTTFTLNLRSGVEFADGTPLTATNVAQTLQYFRRVPGLNRGYLTPFTSITAPDATTVVIKYKEPFNGMPTLLADDGECNNGMIISKAGLANPKKMGTNTYGAGPYELDPSQTVSGDHYTLVPNPHYYDPSQQHWKKIVLRVMSSASTALDAVRSGQIQVSTVNDGTLVSTAQASGIDVSSGLDLGAGLLIFDRDGSVVPALKSQLVRQALNFAVDRTSLAKVLGPQYEPFDQFVPKGFTGYDSSLANAYPYDPSKAKQLLAEAGYAHGFSVTIASDATDAASANMLQAVAQEWQAIGVDATVHPISAGNYFTDIGQKKYPIGGVSYALLGDTYFDAVRLTKAPYDDVWNPFQPDDSQVDSAYSSLATASESQLPSLSQAFNKMITTKAWFVPVAAAPSTVFSKGIDIGKSAPIGQFDYISWKPSS